MSLFSELAFFKKAMQERGIGKTTFCLHMQYTLMNGGKVGDRSHCHSHFSRSCRVAIGGSTNFAQIREIFCRTRDYFEEFLPANATIRRNFRFMYTIYFRRNLFNGFPRESVGYLSFESSRVARDSIAIVTEQIGGGPAIPKSAPFWHDTNLVHWDDPYIIASLGGVE